METSEAIQPIRVVQPDLTLKSMKKFLFITLLMVAMVRGSLAQGGWTNYLGGGSSSTVAAIALDTNDNVFVTGSQQFYISSRNFFHYATVKYSNAGIPLWTNYYVG